MKHAGVKTKKGLATKIIVVLVFVAVFALISDQLFYGFAELQQGADPSTPDYDSGWVGISEKAGQYITLTHNLGSTEAIVNITGKIIFDGEAHHKFLGLSVIGSPVGFNESYGGTMYDNAQCVVETSDGGFAIAGFTEYFGAGDYDFWIVKTDSAGNHQWNQTYGGAENEYAYSLVETSDGGFAIVGYKFSDYWSNHDVWLVKTDSYGVEQWNQTIDQTNWDDAYSLVETSDGGFAIAGNTADSDGMDDFWLIKTDSDGVVQWNQTYGRYNHDSGRSVVETSDGGFAIAGTVGPTEFGAGEHDFWLVKTDAYGNEQWSHTYGGTGEDEAYSVVETSDGGFAITGGTDSFGILNSDFWLVKTDAYGNEQWSHTYGGTGEDEAYSVVETSDGGFAITGKTSSFGIFSGSWLVKTDDKGTVEWSQLCGGNSVVESSDGYFVMARGSDSGTHLVKAGVGGELGLTLWNSTLNTVTLYRGENDVYWNNVRVRLWKNDSSIPNPPVQVEGWSVPTRVTYLKSYGGLSLSGDRNKITFCSYTQEGKEIFVINSDGTGLNQLTKSIYKDATDPSISFDGSKIVFRSIETTLVSLVPYTLRYDSVIFVVNSDGTGLTKLVSDEMVSYPSHSISEPSISGDGSKIALVSGSELLVINSDGTGLKQLATNAIDAPSISYDGSKIAFSAMVGNYSEVFVINSDGTGLTQITNNEADEYSPSISGDGKKIAFRSIPSLFNYALNVINSDGTGLTNLSDLGFSFGKSSISYDGSKITFEARSLNGIYQTKEIYVVNSNGTDLTLLSNINSPYEPSISYDGVKIAFSEDSGIFFSVALGVTLNDPVPTPSPSPSPYPTANPTPTPQPTATPTPSPTSIPTSQPAHTPTPAPSSTPSPEPEPFPTTIPVVAIVSMSVIGVGFLLYFKKFKK